MSDNSFLPGLAAFARSLGEHDTPFLNEIKKGPARHERPIIGYTKDRRRFIHHIVRIVDPIRMRIARLVPVDVCDEYGDCTQYYERNQWRWLNRAAVRSLRMGPKPIYDPDWVDPNPPTKMEWGMRPRPKDDEFDRLDDEWARRNFVVWRKKDG